MQSQQMFVRVCPSDRTRFEADGRPFYFAGANCYYLLTRGADPGLRHECTAVLDAAASAGLTVIRTWAFCDGPQWNALQPSPGVLDERVFRSLDWLLVEAASRGLRLLLVLTNYWRDYGGMMQYVAWARQRRGERPLPDSQAPDAFYDDPDCQRMFRAFLAAVVQRINSLSGVAYRDDPFILAWSLANEPRSAGDAGYSTIPRWAHSTAAYLKSLDPNHMVTLDVEGFFGPSTPAEAEAHNPYDCAGSGCDFAADCGSPHIDFACCHLYPDLWRPAAGWQDHLRWSLAWLDCHASLARQLLRKPLVLSEFGKQRRRSAADGGARSQWYSQLLAHALHLMRAGSGLAGSAFWLLAAPSYPDHDGFTVYLDSIGSQLSSSRQLSGVAARAALAPQAGGRTADAIRRHAAEVGDLNGGPARVQPGGLPGGWLGNPLLAGGSASGSMGAAATAGSSGGAGSSASLDCAQSAHCRCCPQM